MKEQSNSKSQRIRNLGGVPGQVVFTGEQRMEKVLIDYMEYNEERFYEERLTGETILNYHQPDDSVMQWYHIRGLHNTDLIQEIGSLFNIHPLVLEDVADTNQRPKYDEYTTGNFITLNAMKFNSELEIDSQQVSVFFGNGFLISFQEETEGLFEGVRYRIQNAKGRIRKLGSDYLAYTLIDSVSDEYFSILDTVDEFIERTEIKINEQPEEKIKREIYEMKIEVLEMRKRIVPLRDAISRFSRSDSEYIQEKTIPFLQDVFDHIIQIVDSLEGNRDSLVGLHELYMSEMSYRMNQVMKLLTVVTTIFIPLSFLTGLYGMNFDNMPELHSKNGYYILLAVMITLSVALLLYFKKKDWI